MSLGGYRYLNLSEGIDISEDRFNTSGFLNGVHSRELDSFHTTNEFNGFQVGLDSECRLWDRWFIGMNAKLAMGDVSQIVAINGSTTYSRAPAPLAGEQRHRAQRAAGRDDEDIGRWSQSRFAVAPEVAFKIGYDVTDRLARRSSSATTSCI